VVSPLKLKRENNAAATRVTVDIDPTTTPGQLAQWWSYVRSAILEDGYRSMSEKHLALAACHDPPTSKRSLGQHECANGTSKTPRGTTTMSRTSSGMPQQHDAGCSIRASISWSGYLSHVHLREMASSRRLASLLAGQPVARTGGGRDRYRCSARSRESLLKLTWLLGIAQATDTVASAATFSINCWTAPQRRSWRLFEADDGQPRRSRSVCPLRPRDGVKMLGLRGCVRSRDC